MDHYFPVNKIAADPLPPEGTLERSEKFIGEYHQNRKSFTTPEKFLSLTMGMVHIELDDDGYLLVTNNGVTNRFVEIEPDIYQNLREGRTETHMVTLIRLFLSKILLATSCSRPMDR